MKIVGTGFLSGEGMAIASDIRQEVGALLEVVERAVALNHNGLQSVTVLDQQTDVGKQKVVACIVLARLLENSEALVLLAKAGFSVEVEATFRNFLDGMFVFGNVCREPAFLLEYFQSDLIARSKLINKALTYEDEVFQSVKEFATPEVQKDLKAKIDEVNAQGFNSYQYAEKIGCRLIYDGRYRVASAATHTTPRSLAGYVVENEQQEAIELRRGPQIGAIPNWLCDAAKFLLDVRQEFDKLFGLDASKQIAVLRDELEQAYAKWV